MPVERCEVEGRPGFRWGSAGFCYAYEPGDETDRERAHAEALAQGRAIAVSQLRADVAAVQWYRGLTVNRPRADATVCGVLVDVRELASRAVRSDARKRRPPVQAYPRALENRYRAQLQKRTRQVRELLETALLRELAKRAPDIDERAGVRADTKAQDVAALIRVIDSIERAVKVSAPIDATVLGRLARRLNLFGDQAVTEQVATVFGIDVTAAPGVNAKLIEKWVASNVDLIGSLDSRYFDDIRRSVQLTVGEGKSTARLSKELQDRFRVSKSRADLIAVDQVGSLNAQITEARQTALGIEEYKWSNVGDDRVRSLHQNAPTGLGNTVRRWDDPHPTEGHPGDPIRCRCTAIPVL